MELVFDYLDKKYDIDKFKVIFVSSDSASGIKNQKDINYKCPCSMEGYINQSFAMKQQSIF